MNTKSYIVILLLLFSSFSFSQSDSGNIIATKKDTSHHLSPKYVAPDSLYISVKQLDELSKSLKSKNVLSDILPSIIAFVVVIISTFGAVYIGKKQINSQTSSGEQQIRSQEAQSQEQLRVAREQIRETSKMTLAQVRANNISQARINWIQDLRNITSQLIGEMTILNFYLREVIDLYDRGQERESEILYNIHIDRVKNAREYAFKIKLFLNQEPLHQELERLIETYINAALTGYTSTHNNLQEMSDNILNVSRKILKEAWEQAKKEGT